MKQLITSKLAVLYLFLITVIAGCGGGGGSLSTEVVSGVAAVGAPLAGQVTLKDSSTQPREKTATIDQNGNFAFDVSGMTAPFIMQAKGSAGGTNHTLHTLAKGSGRANINPLTDLIVASAAGVSDPATAYADPDPARTRQAGDNLAAATGTVLAKLQPLMAQFGVSGTDPITSPYLANHQNMDQMFDQVTVTLAAGVVTIVNKQNGSVICNVSVNNLAQATVNVANIPTPLAVPAAPAGVTATGSMGQITLNWSAVANATSYNVYYGTTAGMTTATGTRVAATGNSYAHTGLAAGASYYYLVTAVNSTGEGAPSAAVRGMVPSTTSPSAPAAPTGVSAAGGTNQVAITWSAVTGATSYNIYWSKSAGVTVANGTKLANATSPAVHAGLTEATSYYYVVTAVNAAGESQASSEVTAVTSPAVPLDGQALYNQYCNGCHGTAKQGKTALAIQGAIDANIGGMGSLSALTAAQVAAIAATTAPVVTPPPTTLDGQALYTQYCNGCHGTAKQGKTATAIQGAIDANIGGMGSLSALTAAQVAAIATTTAPVVTPPPTTLDGQALYTQYCNGCHGTAKQGKTATAIQGAIDANIGGMGSLSTLTAAQVAAIATTTAPVVTPPTPACGSCHAIPPATGKHTYHRTRATCASCHGTGYSTTTVNAATHANGVKNLATNIGWNATNRTCANSCHGTKSWGL
ncbi:Cytochrome c family protein [Citrifermentans bremense]|uniref:Cytochrome c family protein n=1 Tax=Citrifermentans bremense TaxID=60035 RepID=A0A6S6M7W2_9BACT|nr:c-type cytochrome [Citrifermentans bremense]BCG47601.1 Cytochrome c family protein [Citrifermentans bremense]